MKITKVINFNRNNVFTGLSKKGFGNSYFAKRNFMKGEKIMEIFGKLINHQTSCNSMQIAQDRHIIPEKWTGKYLNHSCKPNTFINTNSEGFPCLYASVNINEGEEITYSYSMTEFAWSKKAKENFLTCLCGEKECKGKILSFSQLTPSEQSKMKKMRICSDYILCVK